MTSTCTCFHTDQHEIWNGSSYEVVREGYTWEARYYNIIEATTGRYQINQPGNVQEAAGGIIFTIVIA